jgi:hypothetical protein
VSLVTGDGAGATSPANPCQQCSPAAGQTAWSAKPAGTVCDDSDVTRRMLIPGPFEVFHAQGLWHGDQHDARRKVLSKTGDWACGHPVCGVRVLAGKGPPRVPSIA